MNDGKNRPRTPLAKDEQLRIFRRDGWLCRWCARPVIFAPVMKYLERFARSSGCSEPLAYHHSHWTRRDAPLLDYMGAVIDHVKAHRRGGENDESNLVTACCKCNALKSDAESRDFQEKLRRRTVKGKYGEPVYWDGLSTLFVILAECSPNILTKDERGWLKAFKKHTSPTLFSTTADRAEATAS